MGELGGAARGSFAVQRASGSGICERQSGRNYDQEGSTTIGSHQWNDCLIIVMAMDQRGDPSRLALSPILMDVSKDLSMTTNPCAVLSALNKGATPNGNIFYYDNYPHGAVVLLRHLLPYKTIEQVRETYRTALSVLLVLSFALVVAGFARGRNMTGFAVIGVTSIALMRYFGLEILLPVSGPRTCRCRPCSLYAGARGDGFPAGHPDAPRHCRGRLRGADHDLRAIHRRYSARPGDGHWPHALRRPL